MRIYFALVAALFSVLILTEGCKPDAPGPGTTAYTLDIPKGLPAMPIPADNQMTEEGVALGRKLFYDPILSGNNTQSCASCHKQEFAFGDDKALSIGIDGLPGTRNTMPLANLGFQRKFFWDGGAADIESQAIAPIQNPVEMHETLPNMLKKLNASSTYPALFEQAFGSKTITTSMVMRALAQFERTLISGNSKWDQVQRGEASLSAEEERGKEIFLAEDKGDCTHCHSFGSTFSDFEFRNTGLDSIAIDAGRFLITLQATDSGKFKTPTLRNIAVTAPYMHDGRFATLEECVDHYNVNFKNAKYLDGTLAERKKGLLNAQEKADLIAFLHTLTDNAFLQNPKFAKPKD